MKIKNLMRRRLLLLAGSFVCFCLAYAAGFGIYWRWGRPGQSFSQRPMDVFWEAWRRTEKHYYGELPSPRERTYGAIRETVALLDDPYTTFVEPQAHELERDQMRGSYGGVGVTVGYDAKKHVVLSPWRDSPAERAGVREGDLLQAVDGEAIGRNTPLDVVEAKLHGKVGTTVTLTLSRSPDPPVELTVIREEIQVPSVTWRALDQTPDVGYIHIGSFTERTNGEIGSAFREFQSMGIAGLILDLRDNPGGLLDPAIDVSGRFLEKESVVLYRRSRDEESILRVQGDGKTFELPMVVLVNGGTASAAEVVAGALQDHERAILIGESTLGKGSVQSLHGLSDGSSLHVTSAVWLTPDRHQIQNQGLTPDIHVTASDGSRDEQMARALDHLLSHLEEDN